MKITPSRWLATAAVVAWLAAATAVEAQDEPSGTVEFTSTSIAVGVGVTWGSGTLRLNDGTERSFDVEGLSVIDLGVSRVVATGDVFNLEDVNDFEGGYVAIGAQAIAGEVGAGVLALRNARGVVLQLETEGAGARLTLAPGGAEFVFTD